MIRLGSVTGLPVVCAGRMLGRVEQTILTQSGKKLRGMVIRKGMGGAKWLDNAQIIVIGGVSVLVQGKPGRLPRDTDFALGSVKDVSGVTALDIIPGPLEELRGGRSVVREFVVRPTPQEPGQVLVPCGFILEQDRQGR